MSALQYPGKMGIHRSCPVYRRDPAVQKFVIGLTVCPAVREIQPVFWSIEYGKRSIGGGWMARQGDWPPGHDAIQRNG